MSKDNLVAWKAELEADSPELHAEQIEKIDAALAVIEKREAAAVAAREEAIKEAKELLKTKASRKNKKG